MKAESVDISRDGTHSLPKRHHHWWRWVLGGVLAVVVIVVATAAIFVKLQASPPPLTLPQRATVAPAGSLDGTWHVVAGSVAGFRVQETAAGFSNDMVGRTNAVAGTAVISDNRITAARFRIDLATVTVNGKTESQFESSLDTSAYPYATIDLIDSTRLSSGFTSGATISVPATSRLTLHGVSHTVTFAVSLRRDGSEVQATGAISVVFSRWDIVGPHNIGALGSLANHGVAEFLLQLQRP